MSVVETAAAGRYPFSEVRHSPWHSRCRKYIRLDLGLENKVAAFYWDADNMYGALTVVVSDTTTVYDCSLPKQAGLTSSA